MVSFLSRSFKLVSPFRCSTMFCLLVSRVCLTFPLVSRIPFLRSQRHPVPPIDDSQNLNVESQLQQPNICVKFRLQVPLIHLFLSQYVPSYICWPISTFDTDQAEILHHVMCFREVCLRKKTRSKNSLLTFAAFATISCFRTWLLDDHIFS